MGFPINFHWFYTTYFVSGVAHRLEVFSRWRKTRIADWWGQSCLIYSSIAFEIVFLTGNNSWLFVYLRLESAGVLTNKIFRKIMFDFKRIIHQTKRIRDPRNATWFEFSFQKYMIYPGLGGSAKYARQKKYFETFFATQCNEV